MGSVFPAGVIAQLYAGLVSETCLPETPVLYVKKFRFVHTLLTSANCHPLERPLKATWVKSLLDNSLPLIYILGTSDITRYRDCHTRYIDLSFKSLDPIVIAVLAHYQHALDSGDHAMSRSQKKYFLLLNQRRS